MLFFYLIRSCCMILLKQPHKIGRGSSSTKRNEVKLSRRVKSRRLIGSAGSSFSLLRAVGLFGVVSSVFVFFSPSSALSLTSSDLSSTSALSLSSFSALSAVSDFSSLALSSFSLSSSSVVDSSFFSVSLVSSFQSDSGFSYSSFLSSSSFFVSDPDFAMFSFRPTVVGAFCSELSESFFSLSSFFSESSLSRSSSSTSFSTLSFLSYKFDEC